MSGPGDDIPSLDLIRVERRTHELVNEERRDQGLDALSLDHELSRVARGHSEDMSDREYFAHVSPEGEDFADRYAAAGYDCRVPVSEGYATGGENVAKTYFMAPLEDGERHRDAADVARGIVDGWMDSPDHRENILRSCWRCEGIGVSATDEDGRLAVYATQNFC
jgi:uncharacterized protein YkwD